MAQALHKFVDLSITDQAEEFVDEHQQLIADPGDDLEGVDTDEEEEEANEMEPIPLPTIQLPLVVSQALTVYGDTATDAFNHAICTYKVSEMRMAKGACGIVSVVDPITNTSRKFKLNPGSINKYKTKQDTGVKDMLRGQRLIEEGKKLQRNAFENILRYGTVLAIADHEQEKNKRRKMETEQESLASEERMAKELADLEARMAREKAEIVAQSRSK